MLRSHRDFIFAEEGLLWFDGPGFYESFFCDDVTQKYAFEVFDAYMEYAAGGEAEDDASSRYQMEKLQRRFFWKLNTNFFFILQDNAKQTLLSNYNETFNYGSNVTYHIDNADNSYVLHCFVRDPLSANDGYQDAYSLYSTVFWMAIPVNRRNHPFVFLLPQYALFS